MINKIQIPNARLEVFFIESGDVIGQVRPKSRVEKVMDEFRDWTEQDFISVKKINLSVRTKRLQKTAHGLAARITEIAGLFGYKI